MGLTLFGSFLIGLGVSTRSPIFVIIGIGVFFLRR